MRRVIAGAMVALDGVMRAPGGPEEDPTGGFAHGGGVTMNPPTAAEVARREKMRRKA